MIWSPPAVDPPFGSPRGMTVRPFARPVPMRTVGAVWRKTSTRTAAIQAVCDVVHDVMAAKG